MALKCAGHDQKAINNVVSKIHWTHVATVASVHFCQ